MQSTELLNQIILDICQCRLGSSIDALENLLLSNPKQSDMEKLVAIKNDYQLMSDYWQRGFDDPQRLQVYNQLLHRIYMLTTNVLIHEQLRSSAYMMGVYQRPRQIRRDWSLSSVKSQLEAYVADSAMLGLEPEHTRQAKQDELDKQHQQLIQDLFDYILTSRLWNELLYDAFSDILLSPTIDINDQLMIVSAIMLSAMNAFDFNKFKVLTDVYRKTTDVRLRQRALVGWALVMDDSKCRLYPEMSQIIRQICQDETCCNELTELQMQIFYCIDTESDRKKIDEEIMPGIINAGRLQMKQHGLVEMDEDTLEDILHPEEAERSMEQVEEGMKRMHDMQKQGTDIYFSGFSQMKRYPFFNDVSNWFAPFMPRHPLISPIWQKFKSRRMLSMIIQMENLCDSDKYSFTLTFEKVQSHLPENILKMIEDGEASFMFLSESENAEDRHSPALARRLYLQDMYRFYRLFSMRREFLVPFDKRERYLFLASSLFDGTPMEDRLMQIASFLMKRHHYEDVEKVIAHVPERCWDYQYYMVTGSMLQHLPYSPIATCMEMYRKAMDMKPDDHKAMAAFARVSFGAGRYQTAADVYQQLLEMQPDSRNYTLNLAICLSNLNRYEEAEKYLYKLNYLYADDTQVNRALAWVLTLQNKLEQAQKLYTQLLAVEHPVPVDLLDYGYCLWFSGDIANAVIAFQQFMMAKDDEHFNMETEFMVTEHDLLLQHQINDVEIQLMLNAIAH